RTSTPFPYAPLFRSDLAVSDNDPGAAGSIGGNVHVHDNASVGGAAFDDVVVFTNTVGGNVRFEGNTSSGPAGAFVVNDVSGNTRSEEHTSQLQSLPN